MTKLFAVHNLFENMLYFAEELGGFACPSIAVIRDDIPFSNFGPITLVASSEMIDPSVESVFDADIYSPRFPNVFYKANIKELETLISEFADELLETSDSLSPFSLQDQVERRGVPGLIESLSNCPAVKLSFLRHKGVSTELKTTNISLHHEESKNPKVKAWCVKNKISSMDWDDPKWMELGSILNDIYDNDAMNETKSMIEHLPEDEYEKEYDGLFQIFYESRIKNLHVKPNGFVPSVNTACNIYDDIEKLAKAPVVFDSCSFDDDHADYFTAHNNEFTSWLMSKAHHIPKNPWMYDGENKVDVTLKNLVKAMTSKFRNAEAGSYGVGKIRSVVATQFASFNEMNDAAMKLVSSEEFNNEKEKIREDFNDLIDALRGHYRFDANRIGFLDEVCISLIDYVEKGLGEFEEYFKNVDEELISEVDTFLHNLSSSNTEYFEAKMSRSVPISEFKAAVVPSTLAPQAKQFLENNGLRVEMYSEGNEKSRMVALNKLKDLKFGVIATQKKDMSNDDVAPGC